MGERQDFALRQVTAEFFGRSGFLPLMDSTSGFVFVKDTANRILCVNSAAAEAAGTTPEAMADTASDVWYPREAEGYFRDDVAVIQSCTAKKGIIETKRGPDGQPRVIKTDKYPICSRTGAVKGIIVIAEDMPARASDSVGSFAAMNRLSSQFIHDINNWLLAVAGNVEVTSLQLANTAYEAPLKDALAVAQRAAKKTKQLLRILKKQPREGRTDIFELNAAVCRGVEQIRSLIPPQVELSMHLSPALPRIRGDADDLLDILLNLAMNACDEMPNGGRLTVDTYASTTSGHVVLSLSDSGKGIPEDIMPHIFDPLFTTKEDGVGLGLASVAQLVRELNGHIEVESRFGRGATFRVYLPAAE